MQKVNVILLYLLGFLLTISCGNDDSGGEVASDVQAIGIWDLTEVNISTAQDIDADGTASTNLMDELPCISGTLLIDGDNVWTFEQTDVAVTTITGGQFFAQCTGSSTLGTGAWSATGSQITFQGSSVLGVLTLSGSRLTNNIGDDLPGILSYVYVKRN